MNMPFKAQMLEQQISGPEIAFWVGLYLFIPIVAGLPFLILLAV